MPEAPQMWVQDASGAYVYNTNYDAQVAAMNQQLASGSGFNTPVTSIVPNSTTTLQGGVTYNATPTAAPAVVSGATAYNTGYTAMTPQYGTTTPTTTLQGSTELGQANYPTYPTAQPPPSTGTQAPATTQVNVNPGGSISGAGGFLPYNPYDPYGTYGSLSIAAPGNTQGYYLQPNSTQYIGGTNPGTIGAFNPSLYPNGISTLPTNPNDPASLQYLQAQAAATAAANPAPDARFLPGGMYYGQNPASVGVPLTGAVAASISQNPTAYPQTVVNTANNVYNGTPTGTAGGDTTVNNYYQAPQPQAQLMNIIQRPGHAPPLDLDELLRQMPAMNDAPRQGLLAQAMAESGWIEDDVNQPTPYQLSQTGQPAPGMNMNPAQGYQPTQSPGLFPPPGGWDFGGGQQRQPAQVPINPERAMAARMMQEQYATNNSQQVIPPAMLPMMGQGGSVAARRMRSAASLSPHIGGVMRHYNDNVQAQNIANQNAYQARLRAMQEEQGKIAREMYGIASTNQRHDEDRADKAAQNEWSKPSVQQHALEFMAKNFPEPSPQRTAFIRDQFQRSGGALNMWDMVDSVFPREQAMQQNRQIGIKDKIDRMNQRDEMHPYLLAKAKANALTAQDKQQVYHALKDSYIEYQETKAAAAKLSYELNQAYGDPMRANQIQLQLGALNQMQRREKQQAFSNAQILVEDFRKMEAMAGNDMLSNHEQIGDEIEKLYGSRGVSKEDAFRSALMQNKLTGDQYSALPPNKQAEIDAQASQIYGGFVPEKIRKAMEVMQELSGARTFGAEQVQTLAPIAAPPMKKKEKKTDPLSLFGITTVNISDQLPAPDSTGIQTLNIGQK